MNESGPDQFWFRRLCHFLPFSFILVEVVVTFVDLIYSNVNAVCTVRVHATDLYLQVWKYSPGQGKKYRFDKKKIGLSETMCLLFSLLLKNE